MCVILTRACNSSLFKTELRHCRTAGENQRCHFAARGGMSIAMTKETKPLWVWLSLALLAIGTLAYVTTAFLFESIMGLF